MTAWTGAVHQHRCVSSGHHHPLRVLWLCEELVGVEGSWDSTDFDAFYDRKQKKMTRHIEKPMDAIHYLNQALRCMPKLKELYLNEGKFLDEETAAALNDSGCPLEKLSFGK